MKKQEHKLIFDLYKHYKSIDEISNDEIDLLYDKYGNIRNILKNLIQEFEPKTTVSEDYLDEKLKKYNIYEQENSTIKSHIQKESSTNNKSSKKNILIAIIGLILISIIIWLLIDKQKHENNTQTNIEIKDTTSVDEEVVNTSLQNSKYGNESYEEENIENSNNLDNSSEINSSETTSQENYKAIVVTSKTYFYETSSYEKKRKAFLVDGDTIDITNEENGFLYASFTNSNGKTTFGWIAKSDVQFFEEPK